MTEQNLTLHTKIRNTRANSRIDDITFDVDDSSPIQKIGTQHTVVRAPESASRVIMPIRSSDTSNDIKSEEVNLTKSVEESKPAKLLSDVVSRITRKRANLKPHARYDEVTGELVGGAHPCERECKEGEEPMICYYHFNLEWYHTMSKACYGCPYNESDCMKPDCIPADGISRSLNVVNRKMPGPSIEVRKYFVITNKNFKFRTNKFKSH